MDFISRMEPDEETADLARSEVLKMNRIQTRYSVADIESFIEANMRDGVMDAGELGEISDEEFEKLILAYDYSTRRNSRYMAVEEEPGMVENGRYRYPKLKFVRRRPG